MRILSIDSSRGTRLLLVQATVADDGAKGAGPGLPAAGARVRLEILVAEEQEDRKSVV